MASAVTPAGRETSTGVELSGHAVAELTIEVVAPRVEFPVRADGVPGFESTGDGHWRHARGERDHHRRIAEGQRAVAERA